MPALTIVFDVERDGFRALRRAGLHGEPTGDAIATGRLIHLAEGAEIELGALDAGMQSGAPSVAFCFTLPDGRVVLAETSMALLLTAADALKGRYGDPRG